MAFDGAENGAERQCWRCGALLPPGRESSVCALCASGLGPAPEYSAPPTDSLAGSESGDPNSDSGMRCPHCRSRLNYRDVGHQLCPVCGEGIGLDSMFGPAGGGSSGLASAPGAGAGDAKDAPGSGLRFTAPLDTWSPDEPDWDMNLPLW